MTLLPSSSNTRPSDTLIKVVMAGKGQTVATRYMIDRVIQLSGKERPHIAYFGTPCKDREAQYKKIAIPYEESGCHITKVDVWNRDPTADTNCIDFVAGILHRADVILISGGLRTVAMKKWKQLGIDQLFLDTAYRPNPPVFVGGSAGALCLANTGLGLVKMAVVPHYDTLATHKTIRQPQSIFDQDQHTPCIGIEDNAAWLIHGYETIALSNDGIAKCYRIYCQGGRIEASCLPLDATIPLASLGISFGLSS